MRNINPSLKAVIDKHSGLTYKEVFYDQHIMVLFYDIVKDEAGNECFDDFFVTDLQGTQLDDFTDQQYDDLKRLI